MSERVVPVADPQANYLALQAEIDTAIRTVLEGSAYVLGQPVDRFERDFAAYVGVGHGVGVNNGTDALHLAIRSLGIGSGDEVITVSHTAVATVAAIRMSGATPVLVDVDMTTYTIDPEEVRALIGPRTKAIIAVHLYGHPAEMDTLLSICREHRIRLIEDCAQAHGARYHGRMVGSMGDLSAFSFYPTKNLGAIGDGGMVLCNDDGIARRLRMLRQYGWDSPQHSLMEGWNSRLDPLQAAILGVKLRYLPQNTARRRAIAEAYGIGLNGTPLRLPHVRPRYRACSPSVRDPYG
jgi:dTDP-4-amino-4,6-dideoxygalactose transaminase